jgi:hypothetical protein
MNILALSTLAHLYAILPFILYGDIYEPLYSLYCIIILVTTMTTVQWHAQREPFGILCLVNYIMTVVLFAMDLYVSYTCCRIETYNLVLQLNSLMTFLNMLVGSPTTEHYALRYSAWHLAYAAKATLVSHLIATKMTV